MSTNKYFKQKDYIEELLRKRKWDTVVKRDFRTIAKYYYSKGVTKNKELYDKMIEICSKKGKAWFNEVTDFQLLDKCVADALKKDNPIIQIESVDITENEWQLLNSNELDLSLGERKILFGMLVHAKLKNIRQSIQNDTDPSDKYYFGGNSKHSYKQLLDSLNDKYTRTYLDKDIHKLIKKFNDLGLTKTYYNTAVELLFMDKIKDGNVKLTIHDFDSIGLYWEFEFKNPKIENCEVCTVKLVKVTTGNKCRCKGCQDDENRKSKREYKSRKAENSLNLTLPTVSSVDDKLYI